ncbi:hypothetical protein [Geotalea toluenoxydans]|uniref:hypothetical protein n=1 Tax=Geotalea toluenoxydans TaxID=421624 RepID=UPI0006CF513A|nr:hypothetical protein [Geotalea toluenoxydans]
MDNSFGPGSVTVKLAVTETLKELPFMSLEPQAGSPIVIPMWKVDDTHYQASITLDANSPSGPTTWKFSGKDLIGNRGNGSGTGPTIDVKGPVATINAPLTILKTTAGPATVALTFDEPSVSTPVLELRSGTTSVPVTGLVSADGGIHWSGTLDPSSLPEGSAAFVLSGSKDRFDNVGSTIKIGASIILYRDNPPAPTVPEGLTAKSLKAGAVALDWGRFGDARIIGSIAEEKEKPLSLQLPTSSDHNRLTRILRPLTGRGFTAYLPWAPRQRERQEYGSRRSF